MRGAAPHRGFSLLEIMVAFAILALALGVLLQIFSGAMKATALSGDYSRAVAVAEARLQAVGADIPLAEGTYSGEPEQGIDWIVHIQPFEPPLWAGDFPPLQPYRIRVVATWPGSGAGRGRRVQLDSLRLGEALQ